MIPIYVRTSTYIIELRRFWYSMSFNSLLNSASFAYEIDQTTYPPHLQCALSPWKIAALLCRISNYDSVLKALIWVPRASFHFALKALIWASRVSLTPTSPILRSEYQTPGGGSKCNSPSLVSSVYRPLRHRTRSILVNEAHLTGIGGSF